MSRSPGDRKMELSIKFHVFIRQSELNDDNKYENIKELTNFLSNT